MNALKAIALVAFIIAALAFAANQIIDSLPAPSTPIVNTSSYIPTHAPCLAGANACNAQFLFRP